MSAETHAGKRPIVSLLAAMAKNRVIGVQNRLPWNLPEDLKRFRQLTTGHPVVLGRKTYESIGRLLPGRTNIILTRNPDQAVTGALMARSLEGALQLAAESPGGEEIFVLGGAEVYVQALPFVNRMRLTLLDREVEGDAYFPEWPEEEFREVSRDQREGFAFVDYERIS